MTSEAPTNLPAPEAIFSMFATIYHAAIFRAALELQIWGKLAQGPRTSDAIAAAEHWDPLGTRLLLDDLCTFQHLEKQGDQYLLTPHAEHYLVPDRATYLGRCILSEYGWEGNGKLGEAIRTGKRPVGYKATTPEAIDTWIGAYVHNWAAPPAFFEKYEAVWRDLEIHAREGLQVLDIACGPAPRSLALARCDPGVHVTLLDWQPVLDVATNMAAKFGLDRQITLIPGDLWTASLAPAQYDVVYLGNFTHFLSPEQNMRLFRRTRAAIAKGGRLIINAERREHPNPENPGLWFYAVSEGGATYDFDAYRDMLESAGFAEIVDVQTQIITATNPS
jgi:SAM-dependent methyltransferase